MVKSANSSFRRFLTALLIGALLGIVAGVAIRTQRSNALDGMVRASDDAPASKAVTPEDGANVLEDNAAWRYALACREGNWEQVMAMTLWIQDRLAFVRESEGPDAAEVEKDRLAGMLGTRAIEDNRLQQEGVEDHYVFSPGAEIEFDSVDGGREDLEAPVVRRTWLRVTYPAREKSLLDSGNMPIRSLLVGVNVSREGQVLKANIIGNLDIDWASISHDWPST